MYDDNEKPKKRRKRKKHLKKDDPQHVLEYGRKYRKTPNGREVILRGRINNWWTHLHAKCANRHRNKLKIGVYTEEMDFDRNYIKQLFIEQKGMCYWLDIPMNPDNAPRHSLKPSLDRLDVKRGYTKDNIVLCSLLANMGRYSTSVEEWTDICEKLKTPKGLINILDED
jgi:hypothetical protein